MLRVVLEGTLLGLTLAMLIGPTFFALLQASISKGFKSALALVIGIFLSDLLCVILAYFGAAQLISSAGSKVVLGLVGGIVLIAFGLINVFQKKKLDINEIEVQNVNFVWMIVKGFFLNILNPFVFIFWLGAISLVSSKYGEHPKRYTIVFFCATLSTVLITDIVKSLIATRIKKIVSPESLLNLNRLAGAILAVFGSYLIYRVIFQ